MKRNTANRSPAANVSNSSRTPTPQPSSRGATPRSMTPQPQSAVSKFFVQVFYHIIDSDAFYYGSLICGIIFALLAIARYPIYCTESLRWCGCMECPKNATCTWTKVTCNASNEIFDQIGLCIQKQSNEEAAYNISQDVSNYLSMTKNLTLDSLYSKFNTTDKLIVKKAINFTRSYIVINDTIHLSTEVPSKYYSLISFLAFIISMIIFALLFLYRKSW